MTQASGQLQDTTLYSNALCKTMRLHVYLPPHYGEFDMRYPVVYLLHLWGRDETYWTNRLDLPTVADRLIHAGAIPPFIAVMPQGDKSFWVNAADPGGDFSPIVKLDPAFFEDALEGYGDYADYVIEDVIPFVERRYDARTERAARVVAGISMGGAGAATLAFTNPDCFGAVGIHGPALFDEGQLGPPWIFGLGDSAAFAARNPADLAALLPATANLRIYLDCGQDDEMSPRAADLHYALVEHDIQHTYISRPGEHNGSYWSENLGEYLGFYAAGW